MGTPPDALPLNKLGMYIDANARKEKQPSASIPKVNKKPEQ
jgi:hypothetical protein